jgi:hypothetical protein
MRYAALFLALCLSGFLSSCQPRNEALPRLLQQARPELRQAVTVMCTPTNLLGDHGDELQVTWRLHLLTEEMGFKPEPADRVLLRKLFSNETQSPYNRICAAYFFLDSDQQARSLLTNYVASKNLRHRFNAALAIEWFAARADGESLQWATRQLIDLLQNRALEIPFGTYTPSPGYEKHGCDMMDDSCTPLGYVIFTLGYLKHREAIPVLKSLAERDPAVFHEAASALGEIGDPSVGPFLLEAYQRHGNPAFESALARLHYRPAVPVFINRLQQSTNTYEQLLILQHLLDIKDLSALPAMEKQVQSFPETEPKTRKAGLRILAQMKAEDPVGALLQLLAAETDEHERVELIRALGRSSDSRSIDKLFELAVSDAYTLYRGTAIRALSSMNHQPALLILTDIIETNAPPPTQFDKTAILEGRPLDYSSKLASRQLREATRQDFGRDATKWREWIKQNASPSPR